MRTLLLVVLLLATTALAAAPTATASPPPPPVCGDFYNWCDALIDDTVETAHDAARDLLCKTPLCPL